jgi:hypothetical protein
MQPLGIALILINIGAIVTPIAGVIVLYSNNLFEIVLPKEVEETISNTLNIEESIQLPQYVTASYDTSTRTAQIIFNFTNPFELNLTVNTLSANLECENHNVTLGHANLNNQVEILEKETQNITIDFMWTETAELHFLNEHISETSIEIKLVDIQLDISGITIETPEKITIEIPLIY